MNALPRAKLLLAFVFLFAAACANSPPTKPDDASKLRSDCRCEDGCVAACEVAEQNTTYRKIPREAAPSEPAEAAPEAYSSYDERIEPLNVDMVEKLATDLGLDAESIASAFRADFLRGRGDELAVVSTDGTLAIYRDGALVTKTSLGRLSGATPVSAIQLVDDRAEVVVQHEVDGVEHLTVCRVIGDAVARVFEIGLDGRDLMFVHLGDERAIRVREQNGSYAVFRWNPWEGMFRVPQRPPTAP